MILGQTISVSLFIKRKNNDISVGVGTQADAKRSCILEVRNHMPLVTTEVSVLGPCPQGGTVLVGVDKGPQISLFLAALFQFCREAQWMQPFLHCMVSARGKGDLTPSIPSWPLRT